MGLHALVVAVVKYGGFRKGMETAVRSRRRSRRKRNER